MTNSIRLFIAIPLASALKALLSDWSKKAKGELTFHKWAHPEDYHITLKFLGDTELDRVERVKKALAGSLVGIRPMELRLEGFGTFGPPAAPSILWAGVKGDTEALKRLHQAVEAAVAPVGFTKENKPFRPHITVARRGTRFNRDTLLRMSLDAQEPVVWTADSIILYESHLQRSPMYESMAAFPLSRT